MQTLGTIPDTRYSRVTIKERIMREITRRITTKDWRFTTAAWDRVQRYPIDDGADIVGSVLSVLSGPETYRPGAGRCTEVQADVQFEFIASVGAGEELETVVNLVAGEVIELLSGQHELREGGDGQVLACTLYPRAYEPDVEDGPGGLARGLVSFDLVYRVKTHKPFDLPTSP